MRTCWLAVAILLAAQAARAADPRRAGDEPVESLPLLSRVLLQVDDSYFEPERIAPRRMVSAALIAVEKVAPELVVQGDAGSAALTLVAGDATQAVDLSGVDSIWKVRPALVDALRFVRGHTRCDGDPRELEDAAVDGLLTTLDGGSILVRPDVELGTQRGRAKPGGIGVVLAVREGQLTVARVLPDAPARRAGLAPGDVLVDLDGRSLASVPLAEAVDLMRGPLGSVATLTIRRPGSAAPLRVVVGREEIRVRGVRRAALLDGGIGYVQLAQLSGRASEEVSGAVAGQAERAGGTLRGLVLDLRGNAGGLLEEAVNVADLFLDRGVIVRTAGDGKRQRIRETREARADPGDVLAVPLVVLVNGATAAGAEIVAGALQDAGRALVAGRRTFGRDTIQMMYDLGPPGGGPGAALKLTVARNTAGAQGRGASVAPDVILRPGRVAAGDVRWFAPAPPAPRAAGAEGPQPARAPVEVHYVAGPPPRRTSGPPLSPEAQEDDALERDDDAVDDQDGAIRFARELLARAPAAARRAQLVEGARAIAAELRGREEARVATLLAARGVDWSAGPAAGVPLTRATVAPLPAPVRAGATVPIGVTVENLGNGSVRRLRAWTAAVEGDPPLAPVELVFGKVGPRQRRSATAYLAIPPGWEGGRRDLRIRFQDEAGEAPPELSVPLVVAPVRPARLAFAMFLDGPSAAAGGLRPGQPFELRVEVRNVGDGRAGGDTAVSVRNLAGDAVYLTRAYEQLGAIAPGQVRTVTLTGELRQPSADGVALRVSIADPAAADAVAERIVVPVALAGAPARPAPVWRREPPRIGLVPDPDAGPIVVKGDTLRLTGAAARAAVEGAPRLRDVMVFANERKVVHVPAGDGAAKGAIAFAAEVPLQVGANRVQVVAREDGEIRAVRSFRVQRVPPGG